MDKSELNDSVMNVTKFRQSLLVSFRGISSKQVGLFSLLFDFAGPDGGSPPGVSLT